MLAQINVLIISDIPPSLGSGSGIILLRHIKKFLDNNSCVTLCLPFHQLKYIDSIPDKVRIVVLPSRLWWYPPVRPSIELSLKLRSYLQARFIANKMNGRLPTHILTLLWEEAPRCAAYLSQMLKVPLFTIVHDAQEAWEYKTEYKRIIKKRSDFILSNSKLSFYVSDQLAGFYDKTYLKQILYPIPGDKHYRRDHLKRHDHNIRVFFSGSLHDWQTENLVATATALNNIEGRLVLLATNQNTVWQNISRSCKNVERIDPTTDNEDAVALVANNADAFLVSYCMKKDKQPWSMTSFPSKFVEFSRARIPIIIVAPPETAIGKWCISNRWQTYSPSTEDGSLQQIIHNLLDFELYESAIKQVDSFISNEFNSDYIHKQLSNAMILSNYNEAIRK